MLRAGYIEKHPRWVVDIPEKPHSRGRNQREFLTFQIHRGSGLHNRADEQYFFIG